MYKLHSTLTERQQEIIIPHRWAVIFMPHREKGHTSVPSHQTANSSALLPPHIKVKAYPYTSREIHLVSQVYTQECTIDSETALLCFLSVSQRAKSNKRGRKQFLKLLMLVHLQEDLKLIWITMTIGCIFTLTDVFSEFFFLFFFLPSDNYLRVKLPLKAKRLFRTWVPRFFLELLFRLFWVFSNWMCFSGACWAWNW